MSAFTLGPWTVSNSSRQAVQNATGVTIAWCGANASYGDPSYSISVDEARANARLIAAAPDLLDALIILRDLDDEWAKTEVPLLGVDTRAKIEAAIAKAEGKP